MCYGYVIPTSSFFRFGMDVSRLPSEETFRCVACQGSAEFQSFLTFRDIINHSYNVHTVALERAVQASTLLPTTLIKFVCKLCPVELGSCFLTDEDLKFHIAEHSNFFANRWEEFSEQQCRVCDEVIDPATFESHVSTEHSRQLFADSGEVIKIVKKKRKRKPRSEREREKLRREYDSTLSFSDLQSNSSLGETVDVPPTLEHRNPNWNRRLGKMIFKNVADKWNARKIQEVPVKVGDAFKSMEVQNQIHSPEYKSTIAGLEGIQKESFLAADDMAVNSSLLRTESSNSSHQTSLSLHEIRLKPIKLLLDQSKHFSALSGAAEQVSRPVLSVHSTQPNQLILVGIKKNVSAEAIKFHFFENGYRVADVCVSGGQGKVTFTCEEDANAWHGEVLAIHDSLIKTKNTKQRDFEVRYCGQVLSL